MVYEQVYFKAVFIKKLPPAKILAVAFIRVGTTVVLVGNEYTHAAIKYIDICAAQFTLTYITTAVSYQDINHHSWGGGGGGGEVFTCVLPHVGMA